MNRISHFFRQNRCAVADAALLAALLVPDVLTALWSGAAPAVRALGLILPAGVYVLLMSVTRRVGWNMVIIFPFMFLSAFQIVLFCLNRELVISADMWLNLPTTNPGEVFELLHSLVSALLIVVVIFIPLIVWGVWAIAKGQTVSSAALRGRRMAGAALLVTGAVIAAAARPPARTLVREIFPVNAVANLCNAVDFYGRTQRYAETSAGFAFHAVKKPGTSVRELHIVVIGETSRADNWQLTGYDRPTNAPLAGLDGLVAYPRVLSQSNTTHKSVPLLLSHLDARHYADSIYRVRSLVSAFGEAGYRTAWFSAQRRNRSFIDFFAAEADTCVFVRDTDPDAGDSALPALVREELARGFGRQLIVLHTYGSHFDYRSRYGDEARTFVPDNYAAASEAYRPQLVNAYDNTVVATSMLLRSLADMAEADGRCASLVYVSDHGEDIFDDGGDLFLHASAVPSYYQLHVPALVWFSGEYRALYPEKVSAALANRDRYVSSSSSLFHTVLDAADIATPRLDTTLSLCSRSYRPPGPLYLDGNGEAVSPAASGMPEADLERIRRIVEPLNTDRH